MNINRFSLFIVPSLLYGHANVMHAQAEKGEQKKNVLFLIMDDMRTELNCYGAKYMKTPNMDALASQGVMFENAYCNVPVSGASRASLFSGLRPGQTRFWDVNEGQILIGGVDIKEIKPQNLTNLVSFVFQDSKLFKKSIYENVAIGDKNASREEVFDAMKKAGCMDIVNKLKDGADTVIGSKGVYLSGGEKQRIAIARAILKKSKIVIMDEASAGIDADNEHELQKAFKNLMEDKTVIMIAHRLTSIQYVDEILVLENGQVIERGNNKELMDKNGLYSRLLNLYKSANDWRVTND